MGSRRSFRQTTGTGPLCLSPPSCPTGVWLFPFAPSLFLPVSLALYRICGRPRRLFCPVLGSCAPRAFAGDAHLSLSLSPSESSSSAPPNPATLRALGADPSHARGFSFCSSSPSAASRPRP